jgi:hypothetical protein
MAAVTEAPARTPLAYGSDNSSGGVAIAAEQAPDNFQVLSVAHLGLVQDVQVVQPLRFVQDVNGKTETIDNS